MTLLEVIKKAEEEQKTLGDIAKVYIRRKSWKNIIDPVDFVWMHGLKLPLHKTNMEFKPSKNDIINYDWELFYDWKLFTCYFSSEAKNKNNKETKSESTTIPRDNITNSINQIAKAKFCLNSLNEHINDIKTVFETTYGISFDCFKRNRNILIDKETNILYLFAIIASSYSKEINDCLSKIETELDSLNGGKKTE